MSLSRHSIYVRHVCTVLYLRHHDHSEVQPVEWVSEEGKFAYTEAHG